MNKIVLGSVMTVAVVSAAYAGWWGWGGKGADVKPVAAAAQTAPVAVQIPVAVSATLPAGHPLNIQSFDRVLGQADAPVTIIEYASMTCSHCADFHKTTLKDIEKEWVATGKAKYVLRDLPWDNLALGITKVTRCAPPEQFYPLVKAYFAAQEQIVKGVDTLGEVKQVARMAGMDGAKVEACIADGPLQALIVGVKENGLTQLGIKGTPTTFVNGTKVDGVMAYKDMKPILEGAYAAAMMAREATAAKVADVASPTGVVTPTAK